MYEGDSSIIVLTIVPRGTSVFQKAPKKYKFLEPLDFLSPHQAPTLEVELLAVGFDISPETKQSKLLQRDSATPFYWNIRPTSSGTFEVGCVFRTEGMSGEMEEVGTFTSQIIVTKYDGLTNSQARLLAAVSGTVAAILGAVEILFKIGAFSSVDSDSEFPICESLCTLEKTPSNTRTSTTPRTRFSGISAWRS